MNRTLILFVLATVIASTMATAKVAPYQLPDPKTVPITGIGLHGDGSSVFPHDQPPVDFDEKTGRNIRWRVPLPKFGYSALVPVGNRVLFLCESVGGTPISPSQPPNL